MTWHYFWPQWKWQVRKRFLLLVLIWKQAIQMESNIIKQGVIVFVNAGAVMGVIIQKLLPNWLFLSLAGVILGFTSFKTFQKFLSSYKIDKDNRERRRLADVNSTGTVPGSQQDTFGDNLAAGEEDIHITDQESPEEEGAKSTTINSVETMEEVSFTQEGERGGGDDNDDDEKLKMRRTILEEESRQYPVEKLLYLLILWIGLAFIIFLKGGKGVDSIIGITCKSPWYFFLVACQFLWTLGFAGIFGHRLVKKHQEKVDCDYPFHQNDVLWDASKLSFYSTFTFVAGIVAGLIGIGGGMVLGKNILKKCNHHHYFHLKKKKNTNFCFRSTHVDLGRSPSRVKCHHCHHGKRQGPNKPSKPFAYVVYQNSHLNRHLPSEKIVLTSSSVAIMFVTSGLVPWEYAVFFFCTCLSGAYIGKKYIDGYVKKTGMASILIGILAAIIGLATIGCFVIVIMNLSKADWCFDGFKPFCSEKGDDGEEECGLERMLSPFVVFPLDRSPVV